MKAKFNLNSKISFSGVVTLLITFLILIGATVLFFSMDIEYANFRTERLGTTIGKVFLYVATGILFYKIFFFIYIVYRYFKYKNIDSVSNAELPTCTVIVPAYNEGKQVYDTLLSLANSDYPKEKLELIAIDDGSKD